MKEKLGTFGFCLIFVLTFGAVGVGASYVIGATIHDGVRAKEWVRVKATLNEFGEGRINYRYTFGGQSYHGDRLGSNVLGGTDSIDSWHDDVEAHLSAAKSENRPITVWVNPDNPAESMFDRTIRWNLLVFALPFALGFGGVGLGALYMAFRTLVPASPKPKSARAEAVGGLGLLWFFTFFWNVIALPVAWLVIPQVLAEGQWVGLLILIFPIIGVLLLWGAVMGTYNFIRYGAMNKPRARAAVKPKAKAKPKMVETMEKEQSAAFVREDEPRPVSLGPGFEPVERMLNGAGMRLTSQQMGRFKELTPEQRAQVAKLVKWAPTAKKAAIWVFGIYIAVQLAGLIVSLLTD